MDEKSEIIDGLALKDIMDGKPTSFEVNDHQSVPAELLREDEECSTALQDFLKLECIGASEKAYDGREPFDNIAKDMTNLLQNQKIKKKVLKDGYGEKPSPTTAIKIHYNAYTQYEALPFDSTYARKKAFEFTLGNEEVIPGLETAILSMRMNERSLFLIDSALAYKGGSFGRIPANATVLFEIELIEVLAMPLGAEKRLVNDNHFTVVYPFCVALSKKGNARYKLKDYQGAINVYTEATTKLENTLLNDYDEQLKCEELIVRLYSNLLVCYTITEVPKRGCIIAQNIYKMAKNGTFTVSAKVYFNHAKCMRMLSNYSFAKKFLMKAKTLEPNNPEIINELKELHEMEKKYKEEKASFAKACFQFS